MLFSSHSLHRVHAGLSFIQTFACERGSWYFNAQRLDKQLPQNPTAGVEAHGIIHGGEGSVNNRSTFGKLAEALLDTPHMLSLFIKKKMCSKR
jgi:hypothetical protein